MLKSCLIFSLFIAAINAAGEFTILNSPKSISFKGNNPLESQYVGDALYAALGNAVYGSSKWTGMVITDPFHMADGIIVVHVEGAKHITSSSNAKTYPLTGSSTTNSLNAFTAELEATNEPVCNVDFYKYDEGVESFKACFGDFEVAAATATKNLNPTLHTADKQFLEEIGYINAAADKLTEMTKPANVLLLRLSVEGIEKAHGEKSAAFEEANKLVASAVARLLAASQKSSDSVLFVQTTQKYDSTAARAKRDTTGAASSTNPYNLATYYDDNYPVIFNIILWFMVVFALSLLAICYAIAAMDPGRDSIIYRMTSTRMKKDN